jgi:hypothetical protein
MSVPNAFTCVFKCLCVCVRHSGLFRRFLEVGALQRISRGGLMEKCPHALGGNSGLEPTLWILICFAVGMYISYQFQPSIYIYIYIYVYVHSCCETQYRAHLRSEQQYGDHLCSEPQYGDAISYRATPETTMQFPSWALPVCFCFRCCSSIVCLFQPLNNQTESSGFSFTGIYIYYFKPHIYIYNL